MKHEFIEFLNVETQANTVHPIEDAPIQEDPVSEIRRSCRVKKTV